MRRSAPSRKWRARAFRTTTRCRWRRRKRLSRGLLFDTSYTWSKSLDTNSLNSSTFNVQDGYDIPNQYGLSDFDARHRFVLSATYQLPFNGSAWTRGWQVATIVQAQSGNPVNIVTSNATLNGVPNTVRPDLVAPIRIIGSVDQWFDPASFAAVNRFGNLGRNVVIGPAFHNTDLSVSKVLTLANRYRLQLRADAFDLFNHPNFGPPGNVVGSPTFGKISRTRLPTGEAGSSRQIQLVAKLCVLMRAGLLARASLVAAVIVDERGSSPGGGAAGNQARADRARRPGGIPGKLGLRRGAENRCCSHTRPCRSPRTPSISRTRNFRKRRTPRCGITFASSSAISAPTWSSPTPRRRWSSCCAIATSCFRACLCSLRQRRCHRQYSGEKSRRSPASCANLPRWKHWISHCKIHPATKRLHVIAYAPAVDGFQQRVQSTLAAFSKRVEVTYSNEPTLPEMLDTVRKLPADSLIFYVRYSPVTKGRVIFPDEMLPEIAEAAPVPIYSSLDTNIGKGPVGGMMRSGVADATRLADMALRILEGASLQGIPVEAGGRQAGIRLGPIATLGYRRVAAAAGLRHPPPRANGLGVVRLLHHRDVRRRDRAAGVDHGAAGTAGAAAPRRQHDSCEGSVAAQQLRSDQAHGRPPHQRPGSGARRHCPRSARRREPEAGLCLGRRQQPQKRHRQHPGSADATGVRGARSRDAQHVRRNSPAVARSPSGHAAPAWPRSGPAFALRRGRETARCRGQYSSGDNVGTVHPDVAVCFFRIAQESLRNGIVHGGAKHLAVTLTRSDDQLELAVADDGKGFDLNAVRSNGGGLGLVTMEERAKLVGGDVSIVSEVGRGTTVRVRGPAAVVRGRG